MLASFQVSSVCPSHSRAFGAVQGVASGTSPAIWSSFASAVAISPMAAGEAGGMAPE